MKERPLSASQLNLIGRARDPGGVLISGFDGEHHTARSLVKRGYVTLTKADGGMWRVELVRTHLVRVGEGRQRVSLCGVTCEPGGPKEWAPNLGYCSSNPEHVNCRECLALNTDS